MLKKPLDFRKEQVKAIVPSMRWDGKENFTAWQPKAKNKLNELLCMPLQRCDDQFTIEYRITRESFVETRFIFQSEEGFFVPCHFWAPKNISAPVPLVICLQGHTTGMHNSMGRPKYPDDEEKIKAGDRDFAVQAVKNGYCALIMEQRGFGELGGTEKGADCTMTSLMGLFIGRTISGERVWDLQRALDVAEKHFEYDRTKVVCMGNSSGGTTAFFASCLEPRITHSMPSCYFGSSYYYVETLHCACCFIPNLWLFFDWGDLAGLIAPRPLVIVSGILDHIIPHAGTHMAFREAQRMYTGAGADDKLKLIIGEGGHRFYADQAWEAMNRFIR